MMRRFILSFTLLCSCLSMVGAQTLTSFGDLRRMIDEGLTEVDNDLFIEGWCTVMGGWGNVAGNTSRYHNTVSRFNNNHTAYIQNEDASYGFRITGEHSKLYSKLKMGDRITVNLKGTVLSRKENGEYVIGRLDQENVLRTYAAGPEAIAVKSKYIDELTDDDLCTYVTLKDCEFVFKDGSFINIYETYGLPCEINKAADPNGSMDGWASLICDSKGHYVYSVVNTSTNWRRTGKAVPSGKGTVSGTLLADSMPRYSAFPVKYQIRCMNDTYYKMSAPSAYRSIAEWNWNDGVAEFNTDSGSRKVLGNSCVKADSGNGLLACEVAGKVTRDFDFNNTVVEEKESYTGHGTKGRYNNGALRITAPACEWWDWERKEGRGIVLGFSTEGLSGNVLLLAFNFAGGNINPATTVYFPCYWKVQYSFDGKNFKDASDEEFCCRSLPWYWGRPIKGHNYSLSQECGLGMTDHMLVLPQECFGKKAVYVRIVPSRRNASTYSVTSSDKAAITAGLKYESIVNFGSIVVRYL